MSKDRGFETNKIDKCPSLLAVRRQLVVDYSIHTTLDPRRSGIPCGSVQSLKLFAQLNEEHRVLVMFLPGTSSRRRFAKLLPTTADIAVK